jgi:thioredoxin reductase
LGVTAHHCPYCDGWAGRRARKGRTGVPGLYVAGDASRDVQFAVVAAAEGAKAGVAINQALQERL